MVDEDGIALQFRALREAFARQLPARIEAIEAEWRLCSTQGFDPHALESLHRKAHNLVGAAGTFGFGRLGLEARSLEQALTELRAGSPDVPGGQWDILRRKVAALREFSQAPDRPPAEPAQGWAGVGGSAASERLVYIIENDPGYGHELVTQLAFFGYEAQLFAASGAIGKAIEQRRPLALIADNDLPDGSYAGTAVVRELTGHFGSLPVLFISSRGDFEARLDAARAGGIAYFEKPLDAALLVDRLDGLGMDLHESPGRVLIVDDDNVLGEHHATILRAAGLEARAVSEVTQVLPALAEYHPELVLMDVYMPSCTGVELSRLIRQQDAWLGIPIVFLSSESGRNRQIEALRTGADDFLMKPVDQNILVSLVQARLQRARALNAVAERDSLTGLFKHSRFKEKLAEELSRAARQNAPVSLAMIDLDHFKQVNDRHGHLTGDRVIRGLARLLRQRLRPGDIAGRYGGEEFGVILPLCDREDAVRLVNAMRERFSELPFRHNAGEFHTTFSAGVATAAAGDSPDALVQAADDAMYAAKRDGRNRVRAAPLHTGMAD